MPVDAESQQSSVQAVAALGRVSRQSSVQAVAAPGRVISESQQSSVQAAAALSRVIQVDQPGGRERHFQPAADVTGSANSGRMARG